MIVLTRKEAVQLEQLYASAEGRTLAQLMENAGGAIARFAIANLGAGAKKTAVVCGRGNNGGDGFVAARVLRAAGCEVCVILADGEPTAGDAFDAYIRAAKDGVRILRPSVESWTLDGSLSGEQPEDELVKAREVIARADIVIDAIYGIGFHGELPEHIKEAIAYINMTKKTAVVSADVPSGVAADTGEVSEGCVRADYTLTFTALKPGCLIYPGAEYCGKVTVVPVGIEREDSDADGRGVIRFISGGPVTAVDMKTVRSCFSPRKADTHKGTYGTLAVVCGSTGMAGAAAFACGAACVSGAGLVRAVLPRPIYPIVCSRTVQPVFTVLEENGSGTLRAQDAGRIMEVLKKSTACVIGCGLGINDDTRAIVRRVIAEYDKTLILDADAIRIAAEEPEMLKVSRADIIITPHPGEMAALAGAPPDNILDHRLFYARGIAEKYGITVVLKGAATITAHTIFGKSLAFVNTTGNPGMAKGGSGDVLAGLIGSLAAQGIDAASAAVCGAYIHGRAGDLAAARRSQAGMTPEDIIFDIPAVFREIEQ